MTSRARAALGRCSGRTAVLTVGAVALVAFNVSLAVTIGSSGTDPPPRPSAPTGPERAPSGAAAPVAATLHTVAPLPELHRDSRRRRAPAPTRIDRVAPTATPAVTPDPAVTPEPTVTPVPAPTVPPAAPAPVAPRPTPDLPPPARATPEPEPEPTFDSSG